MPAATFPCVFFPTYASPAIACCIKHQKSALSSKLQEEEQLFPRPIRHSSTTQR